MESPASNDIPKVPFMKKASNFLFVGKTNPIIIPAMSKLLVWLIVILIIVIISLSIVIDTSKFENKYYDPFGTGIRHYVSRDDTGAVQSSLEERQVGSRPLKIEPLTSTPESPNFSEYYGIEANLKDGTVMIERENFENSALDLEQLEKANKGL